LCENIKSLQLNGIVFGKPLLFVKNILYCCFKKIYLPFLSQISLTQFRNFKRQDYAFHAPIIGITGSNGTGKTNLLDAVYYLCYTKSYFQNKELNNVRTGAEGFRLSGTWLSQHKDTAVPAASASKEQPEQTVCIWREGKKSIQHDGIVYTKVTDHIGKFNAVMIAPDDIEIINGSSEIRRKFIDGLLAQSEPDYLEHLLIYQKNLQQKNAYLKQCLPQELRYDLLDIYDAQLALHGAFLITAREKMTKSLPRWVADFYEHLSGGKENTGMRYKRSAAPEELPALLKASRKRDIDFKRTLNGPHTEDWYFTLDKNPLKVHASQGQKKSFLISLKLAHLKWLQSLGRQPVLLLDDIFEKLDRQRLLQLFDLLGRFSLGQIFLTHTDAQDLSETLQHYYKTIQLVEL